MVYKVIRKHYYSKEGEIRIRRKRKKLEKRKKFPSVN